jgi:hypothetical protein
MRRIIIVLLFVLGLVLAAAVCLVHAKDVPVLIIIDEQVQKSAPVCLALVDEINSYYKNEGIPIKIIVKETQIQNLGGKREDWISVLNKSKDYFQHWPGPVFVFKSGMYSHSTYDTEKDGVRSTKHEEIRIDGVVWDQIILLSSIERNVLLHELGHMFGLGHTTRTGDLMNIVVGREYISPDTKYRTAATQF